MLGPLVGVPEGNGGEHGVVQTAYLMAKKQRRRPGSHTPGDLRTTT